MSTLLAPTFNLLVLVALLVWKVRAPLGGFVKARHVGLRDEIQRVRDLLRQAHVKYDEFSAKLKAVDAEVSALREETRQDAQAMKSRVLSEAQRLSATVVADARSSAEALYSDLKGRLHRELGAQVIDRAEVLLRERLTGDDHNRIRQEFSSQLETLR